MWVFITGLYTLRKVSHHEIKIELKKGMAIWYLEESDWIQFKWKSKSGPLNLRSLVCLYYPDNEFNRGKGQKSKKVWLVMDQTWLSRPSYPEVQWKYLQAVIHYGTGKLRTRIYWSFRVGQLMQEFGLCLAGDSVARIFYRKLWLTWRFV